ncbi:hypothetical protein KR009_003942, partial [Drosophila setifemur]
ITESNCVSPGGAAGQCIRAQECPFVKQIINVYGRNIPRTIQSELRQMQCNAGSNDFSVCCLSETLPQNNPPRSQQKSTRAVSGDLTRIDQQGLRLLHSVVDCGNKGNPKVAGGKNAKPGQFPWVALLKYDVNDDRPFLCGGSLISETHILTAAHCIVQRPEVIAVRLGEHDLSTEEDCQWLGGIKRVCQPPYEEYGVEDVRVHPNYVHGLINNDIAIIKLKGVVREKTHIKPVCLPIEEKSQILARDQVFFIAGWGRTDKTDAPTVLQKALVTRKSLDVCREFYGNDEVNENHICASGNGLMHTCQGDSGGPMFFKHPFKKSYRFVQYGIVSFGEKRCGRNRNQPGVFANVLDMLPWITQNLQ